MDPSATENCTIAWKKNFFLREIEEAPKNIIFTDWPVKNIYWDAYDGRNEAFIMKWKVKETKQATLLIFLKTLCNFCFYFPVRFFSSKDLALKSSPLEPVFGSLKFEQILFRDETQTKLNFSLPFVSWISDAGLPTLD